MSTVIPLNVQPHSHARLVLEACALQVSLLLELELV